MSDPLYISRTTIEVVGGLHRRARVPLGHTADFGVHGEILRHFRLETDRELPLPVDFIVAATGG